MPVMRIGYDDSSLGQTLGGLSEALGAAWNPKTRAEAQLLMQRYMLEQMQVQQEQRKIQAQQEAMRVYGHLVPPDQLPIITNMILQGAPQDQVRKQAALSMGGYVDDPSPEGQKRNRDRYEQITGEPWKENYPVPVGPKTDAYSRSLQAGQKGAEEAATLQAQAAQKAKTAAGLNLRDATDPATLQSNLQAWRAAGLPEPPNGVVIAGPVTTQYQEALAARAKGSETKATQQATQEVQGVPLNEPRLFPPGSGPFGGKQLPPEAGGPPVAAPPSAPAAPPQPPPNMAVPNPAAPNYSTPAPVVTGLQGGAYITGQLPGAAEAAKQMTDENRKQLLGAHDEGAQAITLKNKLSQLRDLTRIIAAGGVTGQAEAAIAKRLADQGLIIGDVAKARAAADQILSSEIPQLRKESGIQRLAGPEIQAVGKQIGTASMPPEVLNGIIANEEAAADNRIAARENAQRVLGWGGQPMSMQDYVQAENQRLAELKQHTDQLRTSYGAIGSRPQDQPGGAPLSALGPTTPPATTPAPTAAAAPGPSLWDSVTQWLSPSQAAPPAPAAAPAPAVPGPAQPPAPQRFILDPSGRLVPAGSP